MSFPTKSPAKRPHPGIKLDDLQLCHLIKEYQGNVSKVADSLGCSRTAIHNHVNSNPMVKEALTDARERWIDNIEQSVLQRADTSNDTALQCFVLKTQAKHRGWAQEDDRKTAQDIASAAFEFIANRSKNPAES